MRPIQGGSILKGFFFQHYENLVQKRVVRSAFSKIYIVLKKGSFSKLSFKLQKGGNFQYYSKFSTGRGTFLPEKAKGMLFEHCNLEKHSFLSYSSWPEHPSV